MLLEFLVKVQETWGRSWVAKALATIAYHKERGDYWSRQYAKLGNEFATLVINQTSTGSASTDPQRSPVSQATERVSVPEGPPTNNGET